jgi:hypothetical protein
MRRAYQTITVAVGFVLLVVTPLHSGGYKCPERQGVITVAGADVVFVDRADKKVYLLDWPEAALEHLGHSVALVGHPAPLNPEMLVVHQIRRSALGTLSASHIAKGKERDDPTGLAGVKK